MTQAAYTADFHEEFAAETRRLLRERFVWFTAGVAGFSLLMVILGGWSDFVRPVLRWVLRMQTDWPGWDKVAELLATVVNTSAYGALAWLAYNRRLGDRDPLELGFQLIVGTGVLTMSVYSLVASSPDWPILSVFLPHLFACAALPWSWRESLRPVLPLVLVAAVLGFLRVPAPWYAKLGSIMLSPLVFAPGAAIAYFKESQRLRSFKTRFFEDRYGQMRKELVDARRIHESLFPTPRSEGPISFDYRYEPMKQIGGDYLFARYAPTPPDVPPGAFPRLNLLLLDVTGHGVSAALTVNRLYGEVERLYAEDPYARPGDLLRALNRYVYLTMADHAVFVTGMCVQIDPNSATLEYANSGHPPSFIRAVDGCVEQLDATSLLLGVSPDAEYEPAPRTMRFGPGDALLAYTDGAIEAMRGLGSAGKPEMFGIAGVQRIMARPGRGPTELGGWAEAVRAAVASFREGPAKDDVLIVQVDFALQPASAPAITTAAASGPATLQGAVMENA